MKQKANTIKVLGKDNALWADNQRLKAAIERVRQIHEPVDLSVVMFGMPEGVDCCLSCAPELYPCRTIKALDGDK
jgi:hypothetical protein